MHRPHTTEQAVAHWTGKLLAKGYCVIPDLLPAGTIEALDDDLAEDFDQTPFCRGGFYGERTKRFGRLLVRSPLAAKLVRHELVLGIVRKILSPWCDTIQLNLTQALALHPGAPPQLAHRDQDMWRGSIGEVEYLVNVMWPFTRYTADNGATVVWPESHAQRALDPEPPVGEFAVELEPGSALLFLGSTLHGAGGNPEIARTFDPELAALVGYAQHRPNLGNFEGQCPSLLLKDEVPDRIGAVDTLRPDQAGLVADFVRTQDWPGRAAA